MSIKLSISNAASKKKQAGINLSVALEDRIKHAISASNITPFGQTPVTAPSTKSLLDSVSDVYKTLTLEEGFAAHHVERALHALPLRSLTTGLALDWLLVHLDRKDLPKKFAGEHAGGGGVELLLVTKGSTEAEITGSGGDGGDGTEDDTRHKGEEIEEEKERKRMEEEREENERKRIEAAKKKEEEEKENAARRAWILQYAEASSSGSDSEGDDDDDNEKEQTDGRSGSVIEDWEVWGDPREVERRRAERARSQLPLEDRLELIATELARTMEGAAKAKGSGDKGEQRMYGQMIGQLKREMAGLGVTESDLPSGSSGLRGGNDDNGGDTVNSTSSNSNSESEEEVLDLFDSEALQAIEEDPLAEKKRRKKAKAMAAAALVMTMDRSTAPSKKNSAAAAAAAAEKAKKKELVHPKAMLQQVCQKLRCPPPRFERLPPGGHREDTTSHLGVGGVGGVGDIRYSVTVESKAPDTTSNVGNKSSISKKRTFVVPEEEDGWGRIEDAQNAVATIALLAISVGNGIVPNMHIEDSAWQHLVPPFGELWLVCKENKGLMAELCGGGGGGGGGNRETEEAASARESFVRDIVTQKVQGEKEEADAAREEAKEEEEDVPWAESLRRRLRHRKTDAKGAAYASRVLLNTLRSWRESEQGKEWQEARAALPVATLRSELRQALEQNDVVVVSGETGSGKTTQIPQFIVESETEAGRGGECSVVCTQPRRIAAISVAERVGAERGEPGPGERGSTVGYAVRLDTATNADTRLLFCTTGILLRRLASDPGLSTVTHVIVDEVHERTMQGDFLIALLRDLVGHRRAAGFPLKVILMSATLDSALLVSYFDNCPALHAPGRTFPVQQYFLEDAMEETGYVLAPDAPCALRHGRHGGKGRQKKRLENAVGGRNRAVVRSGWGDDEVDEILNPLYRPELYQDYSTSVHRNLARLDEHRIDFDLIEELVGHIHQNQEEGAILIFLPGMAEINNLHNRLSSNRTFSKNCWIIPLHSTVAPADQRQAFRRPPPNTRKVVIATNIAETSLTIEDVVYVIDCGKLKERRYDASRSMSLLVEDWVSVASAKQRQGRAGRVREGVCYGLYTRDRFEQRMKQYQTPEMARVPLEELVLQVHLLRVASSAADFTARVLQPPSEKAVQGALRVLQDVGALEIVEGGGEGKKGPGHGKEVLTPLGHYLALLPVDVRVGKLLLLAASLGCLSPALSIAACLSHKSPFLSGLGASSNHDASHTVERAQAALSAPDSGTIAAGQQSDHLIMAAAVQGWMTATAGASTTATTGKERRMKKQTYARTYCLSEQTLEMLVEMRGQFASMLADIGFVHVGNNRQENKATAAKKGRWYDDPSLQCNAYASIPAVLKAVLFAALYPNIAVMDDSERGPGRPPSWHDGTGPVTIHPASVCSTLEAARFQRPFLTYLEKVQTSQVFLRDCTVVSPVAILLFGGGSRELEVDHAAGRVVVDGWIRVRAPAKSAALIRQLRRALEVLLRRKVVDPKAVDEDGGGGAGVVSAIVEVLRYEDAVLAGL